MNGATAWPKEKAFRLREVRASADGGSLAHSWWVGQSKFARTLQQKSHGCCRLQPFTFWLITCSLKTAWQRLQYLGPAYPCLSMNRFSLASLVSNTLCLFCGARGLDAQKEYC